MEGVPNFKFWSRDPHHAHFMGQFVVRWLARVIVNVSTKYEVYIFGHSKDIKGVPKFRNWSRDLSHTPLGSNFNIPTKGFTQCISPQNLECVALSIRKLWRGYQIFYLGHVTLTTPTLGPICCALASTCHGQCVHQI